MPSWKDMNIPQSAWDGIYKYLGDKTDEFMKSAEIRLRKYTEKWSLADIIFMKTDTVNLLYSCNSEIYGPCVLKMCIPGPEVTTEINCLKAYAGTKYCKLWDYDLTDDILLLEKVIPGNQMWDVKDYKERAKLFALTLKDLSIDYAGSEVYPTYFSWMNRIQQIMVNMGGLGDVLFYLNKAIEIYADLKQHYNRSCLLHGDMHQENLLLNSTGGYTIIDPKGVVDDPIMETARFIVNETPCDEQKIHDIANIIGQIIEVPEDVILKCTFIDIALGGSWHMEEHYPTQEAFKAKKQDVLSDCKFAYGLLN